MQMQNNRLIQIKDPSGNSSEFVFSHILQPGREIFLVWNSIANDPYERFQLEEANVRLKVKFTIRF